MMTKKIAFCFMTYDNLNHPELWEKFFAQANPNQYSIYVHATNKDGVSQDILKNNLVAEIFDSRFAHISQTRSILKIIKHSFEDGDIDKAINLTQSCIPIQPFETVYKELTKHDKGNLDWFNAMQCPDQGYLRRHGELQDSNFLSRENWIAHTGYGIVFSREMINFLIDNDNTELFATMHAPEEHYIGNSLIHYGREDLVERKHVYRNQLTGGGAHGGMHSISEDFIRQIRENGTLFIRKMAPGAQIPAMCIQ